MAEFRTPHSTILRRAIDCLPTQTRNAMLIGINNNTIVVGAYAIDDGVCPMLAAHRNGGRTNFVAFARAWDEYCFRGVRGRKRRPRLATVSELAALRAHIESSLLAEDTVDLAGAMADHHDLRARRELEAEAEREIERERLAASFAAAPVRHDRVREAVARPDRVRPTDPDRVRPGDPDRSRELSRRHGWRWMRIMRTYDEYEQAMASLEQSEAPAEAEAERELTHSRG
jgi:hypothetical protein